jgi:ketosteroid isomerase-like protein
MEQEILSAEGNSQMIFIVNKFTWKVKSSDKPGEVASIPGKGVHVWKKQADGSWKILIDMVNMDIEY